MELKPGLVYMSVARQLLSDLTQFLVLKVLEVDLVGLEFVLPGLLPISHCYLVECSDDPVEENVFILFLVQDDLELPVFLFLGVIFLVLDVEDRGDRPVLLVKVAHLLGSE